VSGQVLHVIQKSSEAVTGIAVLNDQLYVSGTQQIAVYCPTTFQFQHNLTFTHACGHRGSHSHSQAYFTCKRCYGHRAVQQLQSMVGCNVNNCLYASARRSSEICTVALGQNNKWSSWSVRGTPRGLSVTSSHNLLVCTQMNYHGGRGAVVYDDFDSDDVDDDYDGDSCKQSYCLHEYSTNGRVIRQISFQPDVISKPVHAVQLANDQYGVTHHGPTHQFSIVRADGQLVQSYRGDAGNMNGPDGIAVDEQGRVFVADQNSHRILVVDCKTLSAYPLQLSADCKLNGPRSIHYDSTNSRLYIGESNGARVVCCKL